MNRSLLLAGLFLPFAASASPEAPDASDALAIQADGALAKADRSFTLALKALESNTSLSVILPAMNDRRAFYNLHDKAALTPDSREGAAQWKSLRAAALSVGTIEALASSQADLYYVQAKKLRRDAEASEDATMLSEVFADLADSAADAYDALRSGKFRTIASDLRGLIVSLDDIEHEIFAVEQ
ncbi:MAG: hypothetical protein ACON4N_16710 [Myxococcota bacterium]